LVSSSSIFFLGVKKKSPKKHSQATSKKNIAKKMSRDRQQQLEAALLDRNAKKTRPRKDKFIALNPEQQELVNLLSTHKLDELDARWRAELCIKPAGVTVSVPEPMVAVPVSLLDVRPAVLDWSAQPLNTETEYLHLDLSNILTLTFRRCVRSPLIDLDAPFDTLQAALVKGDADFFHRAQDEFAAYGIMLIPTMSEKKHKR
jgi:hypothetical protein